MADSGKFSGVDEYIESKISNIPKSIELKLGYKLHLREGHPIKIIKEHIYKYFLNLSERKFKKYDELPNLVSTKENFDALLIPKTHPSRSRSDTYYLNNETVLRTHTSAHQSELIKSGETAFLVSGDVYRKDEIDRNHYNIFHQMEGVYIFDDYKSVEEVSDDLKGVLSGLIEYLFPECEYRFNKDYFPFTEPSFEAEVKFNDKWLEILGCGVIHNEIMGNCGYSEKRGWAFGLGLERLAMILFDIRDIRLFWTEDERFYTQFKEEKIVKFVPYPSIESVEKDLSFWIPNKEEIMDGDSKDFKWLNENTFYDYVRDICGNSIESVIKLDSFYHPKKGLHSITYRLRFQAETNLKDPAIFHKQSNELINSLWSGINGVLGVIPR